MEILASHAGFPLVARRRCGAGELVLIADSCFLLNRNLEDREDFLVPENIRYVTSLLKKKSPAFGRVGVHVRPPAQCRSSRSIAV